MTSVNARNLLTARAQAANEMLQVVAFPSQAGQQVTAASGELIRVPKISASTLSILRLMALGMTREEIIDTSKWSEWTLHHHFNARQVAEELGVPGKQRPGIIRTCYRLGLLVCNTQLPHEAWTDKHLSPVGRQILEYSSLGMTIKELAKMRMTSTGVVKSHRERILTRLKAENMSMAVTIGYAIGYLTDNLPVE